MPVELIEIIDTLERTPIVLKALLHGLPASSIERNEGGQTWSPFDVIGHLIYGEQVNWLPRAQMILNHGETQVFVPFDRLAQFEASRGKTITELLEHFAVLRQTNLHSLRAMTLGDEQLQQRGQHPEFGPVTLGELLATWAAHDQGHIVQITRTLAKGYREAVGPWRAYLSVMK
jgi:hypothetical protein